MHHPADRIIHTTAFFTPVMEHWLEREIAQWVHPIKDRSDDPSHHERKLLPPSYLSLDLWLVSNANPLGQYIHGCSLSKPPASNSVIIKRVIFFSSASGDGYFLAHPSPSVLKNFEVVGFSSLGFTKKRVCEKHIVTEQ